MSQFKNLYIPRCGSCSFFMNEDINGFGGCVLKEYELMVCSDKCDLDHTAMRKDCLIKGLHYLQKWRRGAKIKQPQPYVIGKLIDSAIFKLRNNDH